MTITAEKLPICSQDVTKELRGLKDKYLGWMLATGYAENTIKQGHADLEWLYKFFAIQGIEKLKGVNLQLLNDYSLWLREIENHRWKGQRLSMGHINHRLIGVKQFFKWLMREGVIAVDPSEDLELPRLHVGVPQTILTQDEMKKLLAAPDLRSPVGYRDKVMLELLYSTGARSSELCRIKVADLDLKDRTVLIRQGKGGKDRILPIPRLAVSYLREYIEKIRPRFAKRMKGGDDGTLFLNFTGSRFELNRLGKFVQANVKLAGIEKRVTALTLRHSIASHLLENGMDVRYIQEFLGHEKLSTTQVYAKVTLSGLRKHYNRTHPKEIRARAT
jgi:integrase/recombinase XerD